MCHAISRPRRNISLLAGSHRWTSRTASYDACGTNVKGRRRDVLTPREVASRAGFSYHAILRAIRRGDLVAYEPIPGHYRIEIDEYERWLRRPKRRNTITSSAGITPRSAISCRRRPGNTWKLCSTAGDRTTSTVMALHREANGRWQARWQEGARTRGRTFDRKTDAQDFLAYQRRRKQLGQAAVPDDVPLRDFVETYWQLHAVPNLAQSTRDLYSRVWALHILPRLGDYGVRELSPKRLNRLRAELENAGLGIATVVKAMTIVQSILSLAVTEEIVEYNAAAAVSKPLYTRTREPHVFTPSQVEAIREKLNLRDRTLVSVLAYSGPRPEEVVRRSLLGRRWPARDPLRRHQATPSAVHAAAGAPRGRSRGVVCGLWATAGEPTGVSSPRWRVLGYRRLAQLAPADMARRAHAPRTRPHDMPASAWRLRSGRHPSERPQIKLRDASRLRGDPADPARARGRN
jgi:Phage integrase, N-terminal SAM-like domain